MCSTLTAVAPPKIPTVGNLGCCARAASGHDTALPSSVINSRRPMPNMGTSSPESVSRTLSLPQGDRRVLWADLNCSEARVD